MLKIQHNQRRIALQNRVNELVNTRGFDRTEKELHYNAVRVRCSQCDAVCINGVPSHERGCPNNRRNYV